MSAAEYIEAPSLASMEAEQMVLGTILMDNEAFHRVDAILGAEDFAEPLHQQIYDHCAKTIQGGGTASPVTLKRYFDRDPIGGAGYLAHLAGCAMPASIVMSYAELVRHYGLRRRLDALTTEIADANHLADIDTKPETLVERLMEGADALLSKDTRKSITTFDSASEGAVRRAEAAYKRKGPSGIPVGLRSVDYHMGGFQRSDLYIIAGRPGMGKTALATNIAVNMAKRAAKGLFFSLEMGAEQLAQRILSAEAGISAQDIQRGQIDENQYRKIRDARERIKALPLDIDETGGLKIGQLAARARRHKRLKGLDFIVIDYIQLMGGSGKAQNNRTNDVTEITTGLKALAKELQVPVIALSQLSRAVETRAVPRPSLSDLRESGSIEQDADAVMFCYRQEYYLRLAGKELEADMVAGEAELILAKWRHGPTRDFKLNFDGTTTTFRERDNG